MVVMAFYFQVLQRTKACKTLRRLVSADTPKSVSEWGPAEDSGWDQGVLLRLCAEAAA